MSKLPAFQFYPGDWMKDPALRRCSHSAKGVLIDLLCLMFETNERGVLVTGGKPWTEEEVCMAIGGPGDVTLKSLRELVDKGVLRCREDGALFSARMIRDEQERHNARTRKQNQRLREELCDCHGDVTPMSQRSSSSSSPSSSVNTLPQGESGEERPLEIFPSVLDVPSFHKAWGEWIAYLKERRKTPTPMTKVRQLKKLASFGVEEAICCIENSITNGWTGVFQRKEQRYQKPRISRQSPSHAGNNIIRE